MGIHFACSACNKALNIKQSLAGKRSKCPQCGQRFRIPWHDQQFSEPAGDESLSGEESLNATGASVPEAKTSASKVPTASAPAAGQKIPVTDRLVKEPVAVGKPNNSAAHIDPLSENPAANWYVRPPTGGQFGPAGGEIMRQWIRENRVGANAMVWCEGWATWREANEVFPNLAALEASVRPVVAQVTVANPANVDLSPAGDAVRAVHDRRHLMTHRRTLMVIGLAGVSLLLFAILFFVLF